MNPRKKKGGGTEGQTYRERGSVPIRNEVASSHPKKDKEGPRTETTLDRSEGEREENRNDLVSIGQRPRHRREEYRSTVRFFLFPFNPSTVLLLAVVVVVVVGIHDKRDAVLSLCGGERTLFGLFTHPRETDRWLHCSQRSIIGTGLDWTEYSTQHK